MADLNKTVVIPLASGAFASAMMGSPGVYAVWEHPNESSWHCVHAVLAIVSCPTTCFDHCSTAGAFASAMMGSPGVYASDQPGESNWWASNAGRKWFGRRPPAHSINFVTAHDGFTLADLVAYNNKHNEANGENNNDGESHNLSWNCGEEGPAKLPAVNVRCVATSKYIAFTFIQISTQIVTVPFNVVSFVRRKRVNFVCCCRMPRH